MKAFQDLVPAIVFFAAYSYRDIYFATAALIAVTVLQAVLTWVRGKSLETAQRVTLIAVLLFGGLTLFLRNPLFVMWKPTVVYWIMAACFLGSRYFGEKTLVERMMGGHMKLAPPVWIGLNLSWSLFFAVMGVVNLMVAYNCSEATWVQFKLYGFTLLTFVFVFGQMYLIRDQVEFIEEEAPAEPPAAEPD